jgi:hypothetical protein
MASELFAMDRAETIAFLMKVVDTLDDQSLTLATHTLASSYRPWLLKEVKNEVIKTETVKEPYVPPPRVKDAEQNWPYMRCKNVARALKSCCDKDPIPRSHHALLEHLARVANVTVETFKRCKPYDLFSNNHRVMQAIGYHRW